MPSPGLTFRSCTIEPPPLPSGAGPARKGAQGDRGAGKRLGAAGELAPGVELLADPSQATSRARISGTPPHGWRNPSDDQFVNCVQRLVGSYRSPIASQEGCAGVPRRRCDQSVVQRAPGDPSVHCRLQELQVLLGGQRQHRRSEPISQKRHDHPWGGPVWRRQACEHRVDLQRDVRRQSRPPLQRLPAGGMSFVPGCEARDHHARIDRDQRRVRSIVARTVSSVSGGNSRSGTATAPSPLSTSSIGLAEGSISILPSRSRISIASPPRSPRRRRRAFGITTRPAESMVDFMVEVYHHAVTIASRGRALGRIGTEAARSAMCGREGAEDDEWVRKELELALEEARPRRWDLAPSIGRRLRTSGRSSHKPAPPPWQGQFAEDD
jgi:hypothetical protein